MSLSIAKIIALSKAGFDENTITALNMLNQPQQNAAPTNAALNLPANGISPLQNPQPVNIQPAAPQSTPLSTDQTAYIKALQDLNFRLATGQQLSQAQTSEDILAGIINPPLTNGGENNGK